MSSGPVAIQTKLGHYRDTEELIEHFQVLVGGEMLALAISRDGIVLEVNNYFVELFGYDDMEEIRGNDPSTFIAPTSLDTVISNIKNEVETPYQAVAQKKNGNQFNIRILGSSITYQNQPARLILIQDITTETLTRWQLEQKIIDLQTSNRELEEFAYIISHDLQEPVRMIINFIQLLEEDYLTDLDETGNRYLNFVIEGGNRLKQMINDLLSFSRIKTNRKPYMLLDMERIISEVEQNIIMQLEGVKVEINYDSLPQIMADKSQMIQLFQNLISNAIKYRREIPVLINIGCSELKNAWRFSVEDNGIGIDQAFEDKVFKIFQKLHTREEYEGTGIGLAVSKRIIDNHRGKIWFESDDKTGTTFFFTISKVLKN